MGGVKLFHSFLSFHLKTKSGLPDGICCQDLEFVMRVALVKVKQQI